MSVDHYENFPVASILCPPALRPAVVALYHYARTADDIADEGPGTPEQRRALLQRYRQCLLAAVGQAEANENTGPTPRPPGGAGQDQPGWPEVFEPLGRVVQQHGLPVQALLDLLDAFEQDTHNPPYPDRAALMDYCRRSANPVGRLLLHLYGVNDAASLAQSDAICTALQLINFWQDFSRDHPVGRCYLPHADAQAHGLNPQVLCALHDSPATQALVRELVGWARQLMTQGQGLAPRLPGRVGWELRLVVQGGLRILDKIEALQYRSLGQRPRLHMWDVPLMLWRAARMRA
ncbi:MAG: squalene synthase HpnC [Betaproteobacteria bacterium]